MSWLPARMWKGQVNSKGIEERKMQRKGWVFKLGRGRDKGQAVKEGEEPMKKQGSRCWSPPFWKCWLFKRPRGRGNGIECRLQSHTGGAQRKHTKLVIFSVFYSAWKKLIIMKTFILTREVELQRNRFHLGCLFPSAVYMESLDVLSMKCTSPKGGGGRGLMLFISQLLTMRFDSLAFPLVSTACHASTQRDKVNSVFPFMLKHANN